LYTHREAVDDEGLSYRSARADAGPFAVVDLVGFRSVRVTRGTPATAWVDSGATLGELYYAIGKVSDRLAFPAGLCPTVGVGGHLSGGGFGMLLRRHGLAADHVVDALLVDRSSTTRLIFFLLQLTSNLSDHANRQWRVPSVQPPAQQHYSGPS
jgi:hypothetical protein